MKVGATAIITLGVSALDRALLLFRDLLELVEDRRYPLSPSLRAAWGLPVGTSGTLVELSCRGYPIGRLRLVALAPQPARKVRVHSGPGAHDAATDIGPKAVDFYVRPPIAAAHARITSAGFAARSAPILHEVGDLISEEFVFWGPDGVPVLLMIGHRHSPDQMRALPDGINVSEVPTVSIVGGPLEATRAFYRDLLGMKTFVDVATAPEFLPLANALTGTPPGTPIHWLLYGAEGEPSGKILIVHFFHATGRRLVGRMHPGHLGFGLLTHRVDDLDGLIERLRGAGVRIACPPTFVDCGDRRERVALVHGPNEELFEFVEGRVP